MATPTSTEWEYTQHTGAKHAILERYLKAWFGILTHSHKNLIYYDGFCGPGKYKGGQIGSPLLALRIAREQVLRITSKQSDSKFEKIHLRFSDNNDDRIKQLESHLQTEGSIPEKIEYRVANINFSSYFPKIINHLEVNKGTKIPCFAFIDPFGFFDVPFDQIQRFLSLDSTEIFLFFASDSLNRFLESKQDFTKEQVRKTLDTDNYEDILGSDENSQIKRKERIKNYYQKRLSEVANFLTKFSICDHHKKEIATLFFATNHPRGFVKMKEAMWGVDKVGDFRFVDSVDENQIDIFEPNPDLTPLKKILLTKYRGLQNINCSEIRRYVEESSIYLDKHKRAVLSDLEDEQEQLGFDKYFQIYNLSERKRSKHTFSPNVELSFRDVE
ncbi:three-Cys-motif partner protein TcmP [bacterium]|nr:three-Cys-motif partner protein TcmP [bacterium]